MKIEHHRHLDLSMRLTTFHELAIQAGIIGQSTSLESFKQKALLTSPHSSLDEVLEKFKLAQGIYTKPSVLERIAFETIEDCVNDGLAGVELRFAPSFVCAHGNFTWKDALDAATQGIDRAKKKYPKFYSGLICIAVRDDGIEGIEKTIDFYLKNPKRWIGFDLAGKESGNPCKNYEPSFQRLRKAQKMDTSVRITIHAGEDSGPENIWQAIENLGAERIGHGITSIQDPKLIEELKKREICLEISPSSNWITQVVKDKKRHPLKTLLMEGVACSLNTDDPGLFNIDYSHEERFCRDELFFTNLEMKLLADYSHKHSFLNFN